MGAFQQYYRRCLRDREQQFPNNFDRQILLLSLAPQRAKPKRPLGMCSVGSTPKTAGSGRSKVMFSNCGLAVILGDRLKTRQIKAIPLQKLARLLASQINHGWSSSITFPQNSDKTCHYET
jgi:hypothetical protein